MEEDRLQLRQGGLAVSNGIFLTASQRTLGHQINLTALNAKTDPEPELIAEFDRKFSNESPEALIWIFRTWRDQSRFFPAISDIRKLLADWKRGERERLELESRLEEKFLLEERRKQGQVPDFQEVVKQLRDVVERMPPPEHQLREMRYKQKMASISKIVPALGLTEEQIAARREKERNECEKYRANNEFCE